MKRILVTGANGFVGRHLCGLLARSGWDVVAAVRGTAARASVGTAAVIGDIDAATDWSGALRGVDVVIHAAARVHQIDDSPANASRYFATNVDGTTRLAEAAARADVRRLVFLSSIKVNGERTGARPFTASDAPRPLDAYGESKLAAERALQSIAARTSLETVIVRTPLVYGPGVRANFLRLMSWIRARRPLPLGRVHNQRSLTAVGNLCDLLAHVAAAPAAANRMFLVSDGEDLSTCELALRIGIALGTPARLLPVPVATLRLAGWLTGKSGEIGRLCDSLVVDSSATRAVLGWVPPLSVDAALAETAQWFLREG